MKKLILLFLATLFFGFSSLIAADVSLTQAQSIAGNFFKITFPNQVVRNNVTPVLKYTQTEPDGSVDFYVFDISGQNGFVIVSGTSQVLPVIGYSNESYFNLDFQKYGLVNWMNKAAAQIHNTVLQHIQPDSRIQNFWVAYTQGTNPGSAKSSGLGPMLATTWNQEPYYNSLCPINPNDGQLSVTGCVATAMAQIMKYWNYPAQGVGSHSYVDDNANGYQNNIGTLSANFGTTAYQWTQMPNNLTGNNTAVATLMSHCGISVNMDYSDGGSGAYVLQNEANGAYGYANAPCAQHSFATYFLYNPNTLQGVYQSSYTTLQWVNLLEAEMNVGRVVEYEGADPYAGGHTWVTDGYDANDNLHMNWGWGGAANGYYAVTNLSGGGYQFSEDDAALIGIQPLHSNADTTCTAAASFAYQNAGGSVIQFSNTSTSSHAFTSSWTFYNAQGQFAASTAANPVVTFTGQSPYSAQLVIVDTFFGGCTDTSRQAVDFNPNTVCATFQQGKTHAIGSDIALLHPTQNFDFNVYPYFQSEHWTNGGTPSEDRGVLKYDLSQIPVGSVVVSARLSLYADSLAQVGYAGQPTYGGANASNLYMATSAWTSSGVTWNTQPTVNTNNPILLAQSTSSDQDYLNIDISGFAQTWVDSPSFNYGILLEMIGQAHYNSMIFASNGNLDSAKWPKLEICFIPPNPCHANASFIQQNLGAGQVLFTNTSTDNVAFTSSWTFYNASGPFSTSNLLNPSVIFTGQPPYSATLVITDSICADTISQIANLNNCVTFQTGATRGVGSDIASLHTGSNFDFTNYPDFMSEHWTNGGTATEDRGLLKYDLTQIPVGSVIISAKLSLYTDTISGQGRMGQPTFGADNSSYIQQVTSGWNPATVSWGTQPTTTSVNQILLAQSTVTDEDYLNIDVSNFVQSWVNNPSGNNGVLLSMVDQNHYNSMIFCSPGFPDSTKWPRLDICYQIASPCHLVASFNQQNLGNGQVQFTNTSTTNNNIIVHWTFYNSNGAFTTSNLANPLITFTGLPPFSAGIQITDTNSGCRDTLVQPVNISACVSFQQGATSGTGSDIGSFTPTSNFDYTSYPDFLAEHWTNGGVPTEDRGILKYDLSQIPPGSVLINAKLSLYTDTISGQGYLGQPTYGTNNACNLHLITSAWNPASVNWNTQPTVSSTQQISLAQSTSTDEDYLDIDVSSFAQGWINHPNTNYGMMLESVTQNHYNSMIFCSPGHADSTKHPLLQICYFLPGPNPGCLLTDSFGYQNLGGDSVQFTNYSTSNQGLVSNWVFSNANGQFATSNQTNPLVVFTGQPPFYALLQVSDSSGIRGCIDSFSTQVIVPSDSSTGIHAIGSSATSLSIFPNPNNGNSFYLTWPSGFDPQTTEVRAFDMLGREVPFAMLDRQPEFCRLSISESGSAGIYTIAVSCRGKQQCGKLVLVR